MGVYNRKLGGWTESAKELSEDIDKNIKETILNYYTRDMTIEEICYIANSTVEEILLLEQRKLRVDR